MHSALSPELAALGQRVNQSTMVGGGFS
jgi:hypothetical protein